MLKAHFVHEDKAGKIHFLNGFHKQSPQRYHLLRVAFGGVDAFFCGPNRAFR